ncbi:dihydroorotate dehydrogenase (quinone), mitochondrial [Myzus persicae]|uniref:dihydroorotate dehydrogenase (quinone), mitochondrial n=1 Tax=Myzus persicae TaxID=13164 RepID=UPI000B935763|nr:dihydroorotate dehydrogenase (quinone), mitochondrial [Myzus persicae]XP_022181922.1 dihydroorotate dehydrogenase (quinone), mitochondrial [Myzus persicae]XP_022183396.1 dihydroorotate dehydrogenase (quinone), mitochondrial [Myzus persicae]
MGSLRSLVYISSGGFILWAGTNVITLNEKFYKKYVIPAFFTCDPESAHNLLIFTGKYGLIPKSFYTDPPILKTKLWDLNFTNPIGLAAGLDKQGEITKALKDVGFGFVEVGSITPLPQPGNEKPRVFRLLDSQAIINRYGFNSDGHNVVFERLKKLKHHQNFDGIVGVNLGKNKESESAVDDYVKGIEKFASVADYFVINISSPNTPGLRNLQKKKDLMSLLSNVIEARNQVCQERKIPLLLKIAPDLTDQDKKDIADVINDKKCKVDGLIISNTTIKRSGVYDNPNALEPGGLSGKPLQEESTKLILEFYKLTNGKVPIIGVGGVFNGQDAYAKIKAGASLIQIYTSFIYNGPSVIVNIKKELECLLREDKYNSISDAIGADARL